MREDRRRGYMQKFARCWLEAVKGVEPGSDSEAIVTNENISTAHAEVWNKAETIERLGGDEELLRELIEIFVSESPKLLAKLRDAIGSSDAEAAMRGAHSIKGELSCLGAVAAASTAQTLENMGSNNEMAGAAEVFSNLEREMQAVKLVFANL